MIRSKKIKIGIAILATLILVGCNKEPEEQFVLDEPIVENEEEGMLEEEDEPEISAESNYEMSEENHENIDMVVLTISEDESKATVTWYGKSSKPGELVVAKAEEMNGNVFPSKAMTGISEPYLADYEDYYANKASVSGLEPGTEYCYMVGNGKEWSSINRFWTPEEGELEVLVTGDIQLGTGDDDSLNVERWHKIAEEAARRFDQYDLHLNMGDVTYSPEDKFYPNVLNVNLFSDYPCGVVRGNHDKGKAFRQHFSQPNQDTGWGKRGDAVDTSYWYRYGDVLFFYLNPNIEGIDVRVDHLYFMREVIEDNPDCKWTVAMMHYSPFSSVEKYQSYGNDNREHLMIAYAEAGIDIVLAGHDHVYTRTHIINSEQAHASDASSVTNPDGTLYLTFSSSSGSQYHDPIDNPWAAKVIQTRTPHVSSMKFTDNKMKLEVYDAESWEVIDTFEIIKE